MVPSNSVVVSGEYVLFRDVNDPVLSIFQLSPTPVVYHGLKFHPAVQTKKRIQRTRWVTSSRSIEVSTRVLFLQILA